MYKIILYIGISFFFVGCGVKRLYPPANTIIEGEGLSLRMPKGNFFALVNAKFRFYHANAETFVMTREYPGERYRIRIDHYTEEHEFFNKLQYILNPKLNWSKYFKDTRKIKEQLAHSSSHLLYKGYLKGLLCDRYDVIRDRSKFTAIQNYKVSCGFYDVFGKAHIVQVGATYQANTKVGYVPSFKSDCKVNNGCYVEEVEEDFKNRLKEVIDSLEFKNIDIERMRREGLYYEGKDYISSTQ